MTRDSLSSSLSFASLVTWEAACHPSVASAPLFRDLSFYYFFSIFLTEKTGRKKEKACKKGTTAMTRRGGKNQARLVKNCPSW